VDQVRAFIHPFRLIHEIDPLLLYSGGEKVQRGADVDYRFRFVRSTMCASRHRLRLFAVIS
jgi:hypothetical protein